MSQPPLFSIVMATRDRAQLFGAALDSVAGQSLPDIEIVVVNDGSTPQALLEYAAVLAAALDKLGPRLRAFQLVRRAKGHGSSYSMNFGVEQAAGEYVCFLDDDDLWLDAGHLQRAAQVIANARNAGRTVDLYMSNQEAVRNGQRLPGAVWLEALDAQLRSRGRTADADGAFEVSVEELLGACGFCHVNCLIVRRDFFLQVGGFDETIRWENDRDFYLRLLDAAGLMLHHPALTARHHVPDPVARTSITTGLDNLQRRLWQMKVMDRAMLFLNNPLLRDHGRMHKGYALKRIAEDLAARGAWKSASVYAAEGLAVLPTFKWALFTLSCLARRMIHPSSQ